MSLNSLFWKDKVILLTGHTGFVGSWMTLWLKKLGVKVFGFSKKPETKPNLFNALSFQIMDNSYIGDIRNKRYFFDIVNRIQPDIILHLAAQSLVRVSYQKPVETYHTNIMGTVHVLEAFKQSKSAKILLNITTDKCYEYNKDLMAYTESDRLGGYDPYSSSKACSEIITSAYRDSFFNLNLWKNHQKAVATARAGNIIGGGDWSKDRLIPDCIRSFIQNKPLYIRNPMAVRPWQFVLEPIYGYLLLAEHLWDKPIEFSGAWNFGPNIEDCQPVHRIIDSIKKKWSISKPTIVQLAEKTSLFESQILRLNTKKAKKLLGWQSKIKLDEVLNHTLSWYQAFYRGLDMLQPSLNQIERYLKK